MKKLILMSLCVLLVAGTASADDLSPPPWRWAEGSTYQAWSFSTNDTTPLPDVVNNPYGDPPYDDPFLTVNTPFDWIDSVDGRVGVWPLSGELDVYIPNRPDPWPEKEIWIQLTWMPGGLSDNISLPDEPIVGVTPFESMEMSRISESLSQDWVYTRYIIDIYPNPPEEWITIKGDILVDQLVIDTRCIPEPATLILLGIGGVITLTRRKGLFASGK